MKKLILSILIITSLMLMVVGGVSATEDVTGPSITDVYIVPDYPSCDDRPIEVYATITDGESGLDYATLRWRTSDGKDIENTTFRTPIGGGVQPMYGTIDYYVDSSDDGTIIEYLIKAVDNAGNPTWYSWDSFRYDCSAPTVSILGYLPGLIVDKDGVTVEITCEDSISGCDEIGYEVHGTNPGTCSQIPSDYTLETSVPITGHEWICAYAKDYAGNENFTGPVEFNVFDTIQGAINDLDAEGNTINVVFDDYDESILIDKSLTLIGVGEKPVIAGASENYIVKVEANNIVFDNFEVNGGGSGTGDNAFAYGILVSNSDTVEIKNSDITNIWQAGSNGIDVTSSQNVVIHDNTLTHIHKRYVRYTNSNGILHTNVITGDNVDGKSRVQNLVNLWGGSTVEIYGNTLYNALSPEETRTWDSPGIFVSSYGGSGESYANIHDNEIYNCDSGIVIGSVYVGADFDPGQTSIDESSATITNNNLHDLESAIIFEVEKYDGSGLNTVSAIISGNIFTNNENDYYHAVNIGGTDNYYGGIQQTIDVASSDDTLNVYSGTYEPFTVDGKSDLTIIGNGNVIVEGTQIVTTNYGERYVAVFIDDSSNILLGGLTVQNTAGVAKNYGIVYETSSGEIKDCIVSPNSIGDMNSMGIAMWDNSDVTVDNTLIKNFGRLGIFIYNGCTSEILDSTIIGQVYSDEGYVSYGIEIEGAYADATLGTGSQVTIRNNEIYNCDNTFNTGGPSWESGGIYINGWMEYYDEEDSTVIIENNKIHNNYIGIIVIKSSSSYAHNNEIYDNRIYGVISLPAIDLTTIVFDAENNWWGDLDPSDQVSENVDYTPWAYGGGLYDNEAPTSTIDSPNESSLFASNFNVEITDLDTGGSGLNICEYKVTSDGTITKDWTLRSCGDSEITITVGDGMDCDVEDENVCKVEVRSVDNSGNSNVLEERTFSIDWTDPPQILDSGPSGTIVNDWVVLHVETNKPAICKYDTVYKSDYSSMNEYMGTTGGTMNSQLIEGLQDKQYAYYVLCEDSIGNEMTQTVTILFDVDTRELFTVTIPETKGDYLSEGWNQFFLPSFVLNDTTLTSPYTVETVLQSIDGKYDIVYHYTGTEWRSYEPGRPVNDLIDFTEFNGGGFPYFIHMNVAGERIEIL